MSWKVVDMSKTEELLSNICSLLLSVWWLIRILIVESPIAFSFLPLFFAAAVLVIIVIVGVGILVGILVATQRYRVVP